MKFQRVLSILVLLVVAAAVYLLFPLNFLEPDSHEVIEVPDSNNYGQVQIDPGSNTDNRPETQPVEILPNDIDQKNELEHTQYTIADLEDLENTEHFRDSTIEHIFLGTINDSGKATGYHYNGIVGSPGEIIAGTETEPDSFGVYTAKVRVNGVNKSGNKGYSTFFPDTWSPQDVIDAINEAYENRVQIDDSLYAGLTNDGMEIDMALTKKGIITTAYPVKEGD